MDAKQRLNFALGGYNGHMAIGEQSPPVTTSGSVVARRWTVIAAGLLILALALVVIYTGPAAFLSPIALVVVAAIGLAALLFQVRFRQDLTTVRSHLGLNILGLLCASGSLLADYLHLTRAFLELVAFSAVLCFGISGSLILHALRRQPPAPQLAKADPIKTE
ncbi:MAG: hypothetical protein ABSD39_03040 [Terriglobales bacterium]